MGPEVLELEKTLAAYTGVKHGVGCASGTDALLLALMAYQIGPGDAVFTTPFTFIATAEVLLLLGATPVFVDIDPCTFNIAPALLEEAIVGFKKDRMSSKQGSALTPKGIIAVDLFGQPADYSAINDIAKQHDLFVIEDAAQSFGSEYREKKSCSLANIACTSFFPAKPLGSYGDGGMCFTDDDRLADVMRSIRNHGQGNDKYDNVRIGINGRLDTLQAAILLAKFDIFPEEIQLRDEVANRYSNMLKGIKALTTPIIQKHCRSVWAQYSLLAETTEQRDIFQNALKDNSIPTAIYYPKPLHLQTAFQTLGYQKGDFPVSEECAETIFSLPMHPYLSDTTQKEISLTLKQTRL
jgi:dTDP-4-amino-4,6-dideoxygalactose transaminase